MALVEANPERAVDMNAAEITTANGHATALRVPTVTAVAAEPAAAPRPWAPTALAVDALMLLAAASTAVIVGRATNAGHAPLLWAIGFGAIVLALVYRRGLYDWRVRLQILDDVRGLVTATVLAFTTILSLRVLLGETDGVAAETLRLWVFAALFLVVGRLILERLRVSARREGETAKRTLIIGAGRIGHLVANRLLEHPEFGLRPVGFLDKEPLANPHPAAPILGASWDLEQVIEAHKIDHVVVAFSTAPSEVLLREVQRCEAAGVSVSLVPRLFEYMTERVTVEHIGGLPLISARRTVPNGWRFGIKYAIDRIVAIFMLVVLSPVLLLLALGVVVSLGRPVFFRQTRVGLGGRPFEIIKFRTMKNVAAEAPRVDEALAANVAPGGVEGVDRRTRFGSIMRRLSLDELPQLINVVKGEMSLIGPRPERPQFVEVFEQNIHRYADRHRVKPGITGWAQIHGLRGKTSLTDRVEWDNYYLENWSPWLDFKILLTTFFVVGEHSNQAE
jgi:exopolysaccharide biosynthesis polyprenyl glycosylphosphotransferase